MKAPVALVLVAALVLGAAFAGCGGDDGEQIGDPSAPERGTDPDLDPEADQPAPDAGEFSDGDASAGESVFAEHCATCHGAEGGGTATGPRLTDERIVENERQALDQVVNGGGGMPAFEGVLSDEEIADVVAYVIEDLAGDRDAERDPGP